MKCKDCKYLIFSQGVEGRNRYVCKHPKCLRVVIHTCRRGGNDYPKTSLKWCPLKRETA